MIISFKKLLSVTCLSLFLIMAATIFIHAQTPPPEQGKDTEEKNKIRENIETLRMWKLLEALDLTSEQSTQFLPILKEFQDAKRRFGDTRREFLKQMESILDSQEVNQGKLQESISGLDGAGNRFHQEKDHFLTKSREILTLEQQARLYLFEERFERRLKESIGHMRGGHPRWKENEP